MEDADVITSTDVLEMQGQGVLERVDDHEAVWYPVGVAIALLAVSGVLVLCFSGRWIG